MSDVTDLIERLREEIGGWEQAYPLSAFPEPDLERAHMVLTERGMGLDAISASNMRHVVSKIAPLVHEAADALERLTCPADDVVEQAARGIITAWGSLPGPRFYTVREVQEWLVGPLADAIDNLRAALASIKQTDAVEAERAAKAIFEHWQFGTWESGEKPAWVEGGNSTMQQLARDFAEAAIRGAK